MHVARTPRSDGEVRGWLVDLYDTVLTVDFVAVYAELARAAGIPYAPFVAASRHFEAALTVGGATWASVLAEVLRASERPVTETAVDELLTIRRRLLLEHARVLPDAVDLLERLRRTEATTALVSNSDDHARGLLEQLGVDRLVDHVVLSCEVGAAKPHADIYRTALRELDCPADAAVMVDDQAVFCAGAVALGMRAIQIHRAPMSKLGEGGFDRSAHWRHHEDLGEIQP